MRSFKIGPALLGVACAVAFASCKKKISQTQCDALIEHYAQLVVVEKMPDAGASIVTAEKSREREEAKRDEGFRNCTTEVQAEDLACALSAGTSGAVLKCLE
jgi:fatty acid/phospholipid biosynthesis enzyme